MMADWQQSRLSISFMKLLEGRDLSMGLRRGNLGEVFQCCFHCLWRAVRWAWRSEGMLAGRGFYWRKTGRRLGRLDEPCVASLASASARSFRVKLYVVLPTPLSPSHPVYAP